MNTQQAALGLALSEVGIPIDVSTFDDRLILQKTTYLLQQAEVHLGYRFRWYLRGPYSPDLTEDVFLFARNHAESKKELSGWELDEISKKRIEKIKGLFSVSREKLALHLELLASVLFLLVTKQAMASHPQQLSDILKANDKNFEAGEVSQAIESLAKHGYNF